MTKEDINSSISILTEKIDLIKTEVQESKLYLELSFIALLILIFGYFKSDFGQAAVINKTAIGKLMITITAGLYIGIVYFFFTIIQFNAKYRGLIKEKINQLTKK